LPLLRFGRLGPVGPGIEEADLRSGLAEGGELRAVVIICRKDPEALEHIAWLRTSWLRGFHVLHTFRGRSVRTNRNLKLLLALIREEWGFKGPITLRLEDDPELMLGKSLSPSLVRADGSERPPRKPTKGQSEG
jgi:hypothetical protein